MPNCEVVTLQMEEARGVGSFVAVCQADQCGNWGRSTRGSIQH